MITSATECLGWPYVSPGSNDSRGIDCSGLLVKVYRDQGASIYHGSNTIYRKHCDEKGWIGNENILQVGMAVFKWNPNTPAKFDDGLGDFQHVGLVIGKNPLQIIHASSVAGCVVIDTKLGKWKYWGKLKEVNYGSYGNDGGNSGGSAMGTQYQDEPELTAAVAAEFGNGGAGGDGTTGGDGISGGGAETQAAASPATVFSENGLPVKLRAKPTTSCDLYDMIPSGTFIELTGKEKDGWKQVNFGARKGWWMMGKFLLDGYVSCGNVPGGSMTQTPGRITIRIGGLTEEEADRLLQEYPQGFKAYG
jgi:hypothetical protein